MAQQRVLVVDDEAPIVDLLTDVLTAEGLAVDAASSAAEALALIRESIYDVALLDFNLPDMDGVMLHRQIRQMDPELADHSIFMSGLVQSEANLGYYQTQSGGFLSKPFTVDDVLAAVHGVLGGAE